MTLIKQCQITQTLKKRISELKMLKMLEIKDLHVAVDNKEIVRGINMNIPEGKVYVLMGPNGSGKSTLANAIMGNPKYKVTNGGIYFDTNDITAWPADKRAKKGIFMSFQYPSDIEGVTMSKFLRASYNAIHGKKIGVLEWHKLLDETLQMLNVNSDFKERYVNYGFSGGEKKKCEVVQMSVLSPRLAIMDETDSGLDIDAIRTVADGINYLKEKNKSMSLLIITHGKRILDLINFDKLFIIVNGKIVLEGGRELLSKLETKGYGWI